MSLSMAPTTSMKQILGISKLIPVYQRNFVWDKDARSGFFEDLTDAFEANEEYFIGSMVFRENDGLFEIVDGQQRITSLFLLVSAAIKLADKYDPDKLLTVLFQQWRTAVYTAKRDDKRGGVIYTPSLRHADSDINKAYIAIATGQSNFASESDSEMAKNLDSAQSEAEKSLEKFLLNKTDKPDALSRLLEYIDEKVVCIHHVAKSLETALTIYSRLNSTGKTLTKFEILKGMSFQAAEKSNLWDDIDAEWSTLENLLETKIQLGGKGHSKDLIKDDTLLSYKLFIDLPHVGRNLIFHGDPWVGGGKLHKALFGNDMKDILSNDPVSFVSDITRFVEEIKNLRVAEGVTNEKVRNYLMDIASAAGTQTQWLMVAIPLYRYFPESEHAFRTLRNMVIVFSVALTGSGTSSVIYKRLSEALASAENAQPPSEEALDKVIAEMKGEIANVWGDYEYEVSTLRYSSRSDRKVIRDVFELIEVELNHEFNLGSFPNLHEFLGARKLNLDHLIPQSYDDISEDELHQIGNLCLLTETTNKGQQDVSYASSAKQFNLSQSEFWATKALAPGNYYGAQKRAYDTFKTRESLTAVDVADRTQELISFLKRQLTS